jgi:hypothetical protein
MQHMSDEAVFSPDQRLGSIFHIVGVMAFMAVAGIGLYEIAYADSGPAFLSYLIISLLALGGVPLLIYRLYALQNASYVIEREGVHLRWGARREQIPMDEILWVHPATELAAPVPMPRLRWPGAVLGLRRQSGLGEVEYLSSNTRDLILIGTQRRTYAISPARPSEFLHAFQRFIEMGSLTQIERRSIYPTILFGRIWEARYGRLLLFSGLVAGTSLLIWVSLVLPGRGQVYLGFRPDGSPGDTAPAPRLLLLPLVNTTFLVADLVVGLFFFRREESRSLAYLLWGAGLFTSLLFIAAVFFLLRASPG